MALRYRLLPYLYAAFLHAAETGAPVQRPLVFDHQYDHAVRSLDDQFVLGADLLVAPVLTPGATARQVYLPAGTWYAWDVVSGRTDDAVEGPRWVVAPTPMDLRFTTLEVVAVGISVWIMTLVAQDGESHWMEGVQLLAVYVILALAFFWLPGAH